MDSIWLNDIGKQKSEVRGQRSEIGKGQRSEVRGQRSEVRGQRSEVRGQRSEVRGQISEVRGQRSEVRCLRKATPCRGGQRTDVRRARARDRVRKGKGKRLLIELGISENEIIEERRSKDTFENARYAKQIIAKEAFKAPILVTSAYHMKRAVFLFEKQGMKVEPFSCDLKSEEEEEEYGILDFLPRASVLEESSKALKEYMGLMAARVGIF